MESLGDQARWLPVVVVSVGAIPLAAAVAWWLAGLRISRGITTAQAWRLSIAEVGMVLGTAPWLWMILTPLPGPGLVHVLPFEDLRGQFQHPPIWVTYQIVGNLLVFAAYGFLAPVRWPIRPLWVVLGAAAGSATVETLQWALHLGRVASVDDVLVNTLGAGIATLCSRRWWARRTPHGPAT
ncbi:MAG TPA: VanZ family protein [Micromonosporaceae bacterium]